MSDSVNVTSFYISILVHEAKGIQPTLSRSHRSVYLPTYDVSIIYFEQWYETQIVFVSSKIDETLDWLNIRLIMFVQFKQVKDYLPLTLYRVCRSLIFTHFKTNTKAQSICLHLRSCCPRFESQSSSSILYPLIVKFYTRYICHCVEKRMKKQKEAGLKNQMQWYQQYLNMWKLSPLKMKTIE